jgi:hypothetical protein
MPVKVNLVGPHGQLYADPKPSPDENAFQVDNTSEAYYNSPYYLLHKSQVEPIRHGGLGRCPISNSLTLSPKPCPMPSMPRENNIPLGRRHEGSEIRSTSGRGHVACGASRIARGDRRNLCNTTDYLEEHNRTFYSPAPFIPRRTLRSRRRKNITGSR